MAQQSTLSLILGAGLVVAIFVFGYSIGGRSTSRQSMQATSSLHRRELAARADEHMCHDHYKGLTSALAADDSELEQLNKKLEDMRGTEMRLYANTHSLEQSKAQCDQDREKQRQTWFVEDLKYKAEIEKLTSKSEELSERLKTLQAGQGMQSVLLMQAVRKARKHYLDLHRRALLGEVAPGFEEKILAKWRANATDGVAPDTLADYSNQTSTNKTQLGMFPQEKAKMLRLVNRWEKFRYNASIHTDIFLPDRPTEDKPQARPEYFGRKLSTEIVTGAVAKRRRPPVLATYEVIEMLYRTALCAYRNKNENFTFPHQYIQRASFLAQKTAMNDDLAKNLTVNLEDLVDTPLVKLCTNCRTVIATTAFKFACYGDTVGNLYGSYPFWATRSMVRFQPDIVASARKRFSELELDGKRVLGIAFKRSTSLTRRCRHLSSYMPRSHYVWLKANFENKTAEDVWESSASTTMAQCDPPPSLVGNAIREVQQARNIKYDTILVAVEDAQEVETLSEQEWAKQFDEDPSSLPPIRVLQPRSAKCDAVEMLMMSWTTDLLVNRHSGYSKVVTEMFLLNKRPDPLRPGGRIHFF